MLVSLEGTEGAGKTTIARQLHARLLHEGYPSLFTYEPGGTDLGRQIREIVRYGFGSPPPQPSPHARIGASAPAHGGTARWGIVCPGRGPAELPTPSDIAQASDEITAPLVPRAETLLFCAARAQLVDEVIRPHLRAGGVVISDRYADSTLAYQCYGRGLPLAPVRAVLAFATGGLWPDLTILLDVDVREGLRRKREGGGEACPDRFESQEIEFHQRVRRGYLELAAAEPHRWLVIDAMRPLDRVVASAWEQIEQRLKIEAGGTRT